MTDKSQTFLDRILDDARANLQKARRLVSEDELLRKIADAPPVRGFRHSLRKKSFSLIAEIKRRSPSTGDFIAENIHDAPQVYQESSLVAAISVLTNERYFSTGLSDLKRIRESVQKPVIRKDFIFDAYQVLEARAWGADAILLMANVVDSETMARLLQSAKRLGMDVLVEVHTMEEIQSLPNGVDLCGINSRKFRSADGFVETGQSSSKDFSLDYDVFDLVDKLPEGAIRVAESGIHPGNIREISTRFDAALIGTSLLRDTRGIAQGMSDFEKAVAR